MGEHPVLVCRGGHGVFSVLWEPGCVNQEYPEKTWDSHYVAVWHMNDATSSMILDSTKNNNDGAKERQTDRLKRMERWGKVKISMGQTIQSVLFIGM